MAWRLSDPEDDAVGLVDLVAPGGLANERVDLVSDLVIVLVVGGLLATIVTSRARYWGIVAFSTVGVAIAGSLWAAFSERALLYILSLLVAVLGILFLVGYRRSLR